MSSVKKKWILVGFLCFMMLFSSFSMFLNDFKGVDTNQLPNNEISTETAPLIADNFDTYANNALLWGAWVENVGNHTSCNITLTTTQCVSPTKSVKFTDNSIAGASDYAGMLKVLPDITKFLYISFYAYPDQTDEYLAMWVANSSWSAGLHFGFGADGKIFYDSGGGRYTPLAYSKQKWYHFEVLYDIQSRRYTGYIDNVLVWQNVPTLTDVSSAAIIHIWTPPTYGTGHSIFYLDDLIIREWFVKNQYNMTEQGGTVLIEDNFNSYANDNAVKAAGWQYNTTMNTFVNLISNSANAHSSPKSIRLYDNNASTLPPSFCELKKNFPRTSNIYFRAYIKPAQTTRTLTVRIGYKSGSGSGLPFLQGAVFLIRDNGMFQYYSPTEGYHDLVSYQANQWYKIEIFASGDLQCWSFRVNDVWRGIGLPFSTSTKNFTAISFETAWGDSTGKIFYIDDVFVSENLSDSILSGTPVNGFDEKQLLNGDSNYQTIQSTNVNGIPTVAAIYQFNYSEYSQGMLEQLMLHYSYRTAANNTQGHYQNITTASDFASTSWIKSNTAARTPGLKLDVHQCGAYTFPASATCGNYQQISGNWYDTWVGLDNIYWMLQTVTDNTYSYMKMFYNNPDGTRQRQYKQLTHNYNLRFDSLTPGDPNGHLAITTTSGTPTSGDTFPTYRKADIPLSGFHPNSVTYTHTPDYNTGDLGEKYLYDMVHVAYRWQGTLWDDTWLSWEYSGINWYWDEYYASGTATKTFTLASAGSYKQVHNITYTATTPGGTIGLQYNALTPSGWTGWRSTTNGTRINVLANQIQVQFTLTPEMSLKQTTPTVTRMIINYGDPATITSMVSFYNYQTASWTPVLSKTGFGIQTLQDYILGVGKYFNSKSILQAKVVTTTTEAPCFIFSIDRLFINCTKPTSYLIVENQTEDGIMVVENNTFVSTGTPYIASYLDFPITIAYYTKLGVDYLTSTNATLFYKINTGVWKSLSIGKNFGRTHQTILIKEDNYIKGDVLSYYLYFEQYSGQSLITKFYWAHNGTNTDQAGARNNAFQKQVLSILTNLTLTYSVFYKSQRPVPVQVATGENITTYPIRRIMYENFTVNFRETSSAQNKFNVTFPTEPLLNHTIDENSRNISSTISSDFSEEQGIKSPFTLALERQYPIEFPIQLPQLAYDSFLPSMNLTFPGITSTALLMETEFFGSPLRKVLTFQSDNVTIRYDASSGIMMYFEYNWGGINTLQRIVIALVNNNKNYTINLQIDKRWEVQEEGTQIETNQPLFILYDPPGDNSYTSLSTATTLTFGMGLEMSSEEKKYMETESKFFGVGGGLQMSSTYKTGIETDMEIGITMERSFTSSVESENASFIGPGRGDLYYLVGYIVLWNVSVWNFYIVNNTADVVGHSLDDLWVWQNGSKIDYGVKIESDIEELAAYLPIHGLSNLTQFNIFADNMISNDASNNETPYVQKVQTLKWDPSVLTDIGYSYTTTATVKTSVSLEISLDTYALIDLEAEDPLTETTIFESSNKIGMSLDFSIGITSTTSTETNRQMNCHLEDDDPAPIGQHDQFLMDIYRDLRYNTFGFIIYKDLTYTSRPYEPGYSKDRRLPVQCELFNIDEYLRDIETLSCAAIDEETGIFKVAFFWDVKPTLDEFSRSIDVKTEPSSPDVYQVYWNTIGLQGTYYLWAVVYDNNLPLWNYLASEPYIVYVDNVDPSNCELRAYEPYREAIRLYADAYDADSGIIEVEYWDGVPEASNATRLGISYDASSSFQYVWATDPSGTDDGMHTIYARAYDRAGNHLDSFQMEIKVMNVDEEKPTWSWVMVPNVIQNSMTTIAINVSDNAAIKKVSLHISGMDFPYSDVMMTPIGGNVYEYSYLLTSTGTMSYCISIEDTAGNIAYVIGSFTVAASGETGLDFFLNYLLFPILLVIILTIILLIMRSSYRKNRQKIAELEATLKKVASLQSKDEKRSLKDIAGLK